MIVPTTEQILFFDADLHPPPKHNKLLLLSKFGVCTIGVYEANFHVGWYYLPKIPSTLKKKLTNS